MSIGDKPAIPIPGYGATNAGNTQDIKDKLNILASDSKKGKWFKTNEHGEIVTTASDRSAWRAVRGLTTEQKKEYRDLAQGFLVLANKVSKELQSNRSLSFEAKEEMQKNLEIISEKIQKIKGFSIADKDADPAQNTTATNNVFAGKLMIQNNQCNLNIVSLAQKLVKEPNYWDKDLYKRLNDEEGLLYHASGKKFIDGLGQKARINILEAWRLQNHHTVKTHPFMHIHRKDNEVIKIKLDILIIEFVNLITHIAEDPNNISFKYNQFIEACRHSD